MKAPALVIKEVTPPTVRCGMSPGWTTTGRPCSVWPLPRRRSSATFGYRPASAEQTRDSKSVARLLQNTSLGNNNNKKGNLGCTVLSRVGSCYMSMYRKVTQRAPSWRISISNASTATRRLLGWRGASLELEVAIDAVRLAALCELLLLSLV